MPRLWLHAWTQMFLIERLLKSGATQEYVSGKALALSTLIRDIPIPLERESWRDVT